MRRCIFGKACNFQRLETYAFDLPLPSPKVYLIAIYFFKFDDF